jgi:hypothetical protein
LSRSLPLVAGVAFLSLSLLALSPAPVQAVLPLNLLQDQNPAPHSLLGTEISDLKWSGRYLWVATERGLARLDPAQSQGLSPAEWITYAQEQGLGRGAVSAVDAAGETVWAATLFDTTIAGLGDFQVGGGLDFSTDAGQTWKHIGNEAIFDTTKAGFSEGPRTPINNACFGLAMTGDSLWAAFFAGSLVRSPDQGQSWERVLPDGAKRRIYGDNAGVVDSLRALADSLEKAGGPVESIALALTQADSLAAQTFLHHTYAVLAFGDTVWVGTASGIARSFDQGRTWTNHKVRLDAQGNLLPGNIAGNWAVALKRQVLPDGGSIIWAGTRSTGAIPGERDGISFSRDNGHSWQITAPTYAWDFSFTQNQVWASTNQGLYASSDQGRTWERVEVRDQATGEELTGVFNGLETVGEVLWVGAENGLGRSADEGQTWAVVKSLVRPLSLDRGEVVGEAGLVDSSQTYAAPNPFAPSQDEKARIVYSLSRGAQVTIEIYDFASRKVRTLIHAEARAGGQNHASDTWDGRDEEGDPVANGVYFYRIELDSGQEAFGKIVVLD